MRGSRRVLAVVVSAVLGAGCGVVTGIAIPHHIDDPLSLGAPLVNLHCSKNKSVVMVEWGKPSAALASAVVNNPGARYLEPSHSCNTAWRYQRPGETSVRPDPEYVVYLGPYDIRRACQIRMAHKRWFVTQLTAHSAEMVQCVCHVDLASAPVLGPRMKIDAESIVWVRQLQQMLVDAHLLKEVTGVYDRATQQAVRTEQAKGYPQPSGIVDSATWAYLASRLCHRYQS